MSADKVASLKKEWNACLNQSGGQPGRCEKIEKDLAAASKSAGINACIQETTNLMRCTMNRTRKTGCDAEFLMMRECNRAGGRELVSEKVGFSVAPDKGNLYVPGASSLVMSTPPKRTLEGMTEFGKDYAASLGAAEPAF